MSLLKDPCPLPDKLNRRSLNEKDRVLFAPMSDVGDILYDKDAVYIDVPGRFEPSASDGCDQMASSIQPGQEMVFRLQKASATLNEQLEQSEIQLFSHSKPLRAENTLENSHKLEENTLEKANNHLLTKKSNLGETSDDEDDPRIKESKEYDHVSGRYRRRAMFAKNMESFDTGSQVETDESSEDNFVNTQEAHMPTRESESDDEDLPYAETDSDLELSVNDEDTRHFNDLNEEHDVESQCSDHEDSSRVSVSLSEEDNNDIDGSTNWRKGLSLTMSQPRKVNLMTFVYGNLQQRGLNPSENSLSRREQSKDDEDDEDLFRPQLQINQGKNVELNNNEEWDTCKVSLNPEELDHWNDEKVMMKLYIS